MFSCCWATWMSCFLLNLKLIVLHKHFYVLQVRHDAGTAGLPWSWTEDVWDRWVHLEVMRWRGYISLWRTYSLWFGLSQDVLTTNICIASRLIFYFDLNVSLKFCVSWMPMGPNLQLQPDSADWLLWYPSYWTAAFSTTSLSCWCSNSTAVRDIGIWLIVYFTHSNLTVSDQVINPSLPLICRDCSRCSSGTSRAVPWSVYGVGHHSCQAVTHLYVSYGIIQCQLSVFCSLRQFFERAREMEFFKSVIQIPDLPDVSNRLP